MITLEKLSAYGADVKEGVARCMGMEDFYLELVEMMFEDENFAALEKAVAEGDAARAFDAAHSLKGSLGNLELTPVARPVKEITEKLRNAKEMPDLTDLMSEYEKALADLRALND
ncbi:MAG: Hpt domain-containing protein [Mogibacterium sp.]|nr:Hpt domain-containing protein [Mogibacterium sp.]